MGGDDLGAGIKIILDDQYTQAADRIKAAHTGLSETLTGAGQKAFMMNELREGLQAFAQGLDTVIEPGMRFDQSMHELQAITGATKEQLGLIGDEALKLASQFGGSAADNVESFKLLLSKIGPDIAQSPKALASMGDSVDTLAKSMGGDVIGAANALSTSLNIYAGNLTDPIAQSGEMIRQMNVMAAAAQEGSAEVPQIAETIKVAGLAAKNAGVSFEEFNVLIQLMGKGAIYGSEAGTALRNTLAIMSRGEYMPKSAREGLIAAGVDIARIGDASIPVAERLQELSKIQGDAALIGEVFGMENQNAFRVLMEGLPTMDKYVTAISGTESASEQAAVIMDSWAEKMSRVQARMENMAISVFEATKSFLPFVKMGVEGAIMLTQFVPALQGMQAAFTAVRTAATAALVPLLPWIAAAAAIAGIFLAARYAVHSFQDVMNGGKYESGFWGVIQKIGGVIYGIIQVFQSWDGETWTMSESMRDALQNMGILEFVLNAATWIVRIKEFLKGMIDGFIEVWHTAKAVWSAVSTAVSSALGPIIEQMKEWGFMIGATDSALSSWAISGKLLAELIGGFLLAGFIALTAAAISFAISMIISLAPIILIGAALYGVYAAIMYVIDGWASFKAAVIDTITQSVLAVAGFVDFLIAIPDLVINVGAQIVQNIADGIMSAWDGLKTMLIGLIGDLPMGSSILSMIGAGPDEAGGEGAGNLAINDSKFGGGGVSSIGNSVAARKGSISAPAPATVFDKSSNTVQNVQVSLNLDGQEMSKQMIDIGAFNDSRK